MLCRKMCFINYIDYGIANIGVVGMAIKIGADQFSIPGPFIFCVGSRMNSDKSATGLNPPVQFKLLRIIQYISRRIEKHNYVVVL